MTRARRRVWWAVGASSAAVLVLIGVLVALGHDAHHAHSARPGVATMSSRPSTPAQPSTTSPTRTASTTKPAGYKLVSYEGIELAVPHNLTVTHSDCAPPINAVYSSNGVGSHCIVGCPFCGPHQRGPKPPAHATGVWLEHRPEPLFASSDEPRGRISRAHEQRGHRTVAGVKVVVVAPTKTTVEKILASVRAVTTDHLGCPSHPGSAEPPRQTPASALIPGAPVSAVICELGRIGYRGSYWLVGSERFDHAHTAALAAAIDALPAATSSRVKDEDREYARTYDWVQFVYASGQRRVIALPTDYEPAYVTDGLRAAVDRHFGLDLEPLLAGEQ